MSEQKPISLVLLVFNEVHTIEAELREFHQKIISKLPGSEIIVAEDGSTDGSTELIRSLADELNIVHLHSDQRLGYANALRRAVLAAKNEWVFFSDTGGKHEPNDFWKLYELRDEYDYISGCKVNRTDQWYRQILTLVYNWAIRQYMGYQFFDADCGFKLFNRAVVQKVFVPQLKFKSLVGSEIALRTQALGFRVREVNVSYRQRHGESRGIPPKTIPKTVLRSLRQLKDLKQELSL